MVGDEEEMPLAKSEVVVLVQERTVAASVLLQLLAARCCGQLVPNAPHSHLGQPSESALCDRNKRPAGH